MLDAATILKVLEALSDAGLCVCESSIIGLDHPGAITDFEYAIGRIEESGGLSDDSLGLLSDGSLER